MKQSIDSLTDGSREQGLIRDSISCVRVGRGSMEVVQRQELKSNLLSALNTEKGLSSDRHTDVPTLIVTNRVACTRLKILIGLAH